MAVGRVARRELEVMGHDEKASEGRLTAPCFASELILQVRDRGTTCLGAIFFRHEPLGVGAITYLNILSLHPPGALA